MNALAKLLPLLLLGFFGYSQNIQQKSFSMTVQGTSNLHDWESKVAAMTSSGTIAMENGQLTSINKLAVTVPVKKIQSGKDLMDKKTFDAFNEPKNPNISFVLKSASVSGNRATLNGTLSMNGNSKTVTILCTVAQSGSQLTLSGTYEIDMTHYKMAPPTAVMGTIKVGPTVKIPFTVIYTIQ